VSTDDPLAAVSAFALAASTVLLLGWLRVEPGGSSRHLLHAAAVAASAAALLLAGPVHIYGMILAFPLLIGGLVAIRSEVWSITPYRFMLALGAVYVVAVLLTQDYGGGGVQWGGRYLFLALPAVVPPAVAAITLAVERIDRRTAIAVVTALVIGAAALSVTSIRLIADRHVATEGLVITVAEAAATAGPAGDGGGPVVFSPFTNIGRVAWETVGDVRYLLMYEEDVVEYIDRFAALSDIERFLLLASDEAEVEQFEGHGFVVSEELARVGPGRLIIMERSS
jgi:hypothetical protein